MTDTRASQAIRDALVLYELSLSVGSSMDPVANARAFLHALLKRKNLSYASLWLNGDIWQNEPGKYVLLQAIPQARSLYPEVGQENILCSLPSEQEWLRIDEQDPCFHKLIAERGVKGGVYVIYHLPHVGILKLFSNNKQALPDADLTRLRAVIQKFSVSMEGALATEKLNQSILQEKQAREEISQQQALLHCLIDSIPDLLFFKSTDGVYLGCNQAFCEFTGKTKEELTGKTDLDLFDRKTAEFFIEQDQLMLSRKTARRNEEWCTYPDGHKVLLDTLKTPYNGPNGELLGLIGLSRDITEQHALRGRLAFSDAMINQSHDPIYCLDPSDGFRMTFVNDAACRHFGYSREEVLRMRLPEWDLTFTQDKLENFLSRIQSSKGTTVFESVHQVAGGKEVPVEVSATLLEFENKQYIVGYIQDITERYQTEQQIRQLAFHDPLTLLPNRRLFLDRLEQQYAQSVRYREQFAVILMDLDHFKEVNDTMGHPVGDKYLQEVSFRLKKLVRESDTLARLGGDEFAILLGHVSSKQNVIDFAHKLNNALRIPFSAGDSTIISSTSMGIVLCDGSRTTLTENLMAHADVALYAAKTAGRDQFKFYEETMHQQVERESVIARQLSHALEDQQLYLHFQPQFDLKTGELRGFEALLRWYDAQLGEVSPAEFIPIAEKRGLIESIGLWVADRVCQQALEWRDRNFHFGQLAFNLSRMQLRNAAHVEQIACALVRAGVPAHYLEIEITESGFSDASQDAVTMLEELHDAGFRLAIDDFGTGYSSMISLRQIKTDRLKIDREFIRDMMEDNDDATIVKGIIALAASLQMETVAEGVETEEQKAFLIENGCDLAQGYLYAKPMSAEDVLKKFQ